MRLTFLGGADEVGASCVLLETVGKRLVVDCGVRLSGQERLPWLGAIEDAGGADALLLTHAHTDHTGALPLLVQTSPCPLYMTGPTLELTRILLYDALKIMRSESEREGEVPLYPPEAAQRVLELARLVAWRQPEVLFDGLVRVTYLPAGHVLGASSVLVESSEGAVLMGGDVSGPGQLTVEGFDWSDVPPGSVDAVVCEATYGGKAHASRRGEERRLIAQAREVMERGGLLLVPAFALGRAQELLLVLARAMEDGELPPVPVYADGLVRQMCQAYWQHPRYATSWMRHRIRAKGNPFFSHPMVRTVMAPEMRAQIVREKPAIVIASSGMLTGGPSQWFAAEIASDPRSHIAITGYQDEESPGRRIQNLAKAGGGALTLGDKEVELKCSVGTYSLSAHADTPELSAALARIRPKEVFLVHGDHGARAALQKNLQGLGLRQVHTPMLGETFEVSPPSSDHAAPFYAPRRVSASYVAGQTQETPSASASNGASSPPLEGEDRASEAAVEAPSGRGAARARRGGASGAQRRPQEGAFASAQEPSRAMFAAPQGRSEVSGEAVLSVGVSGSGGGDVGLAPSSSLGPQSLAELRTLAQRLLARDGGARGYSAEDLLEEWLGEDAVAEVERVGALVELLRHPDSSFSSARHLYRIRSLHGEVLGGAPPPQLNPQQASDLARERFGAVPGYLFKVGAQQTLRILTLHFHFPDVAREACQSLSEGFVAQSGWRVRLHDAPHQEALAAAALEALPPEVRAVGAPALHMAERRVALKLEATLPSAQRQAAQDAFVARTGFRLDLGDEPPASKTAASKPQGRVWEPSAARPRLDQARAREEVLKRAHAIPDEIFRISFHADRATLSFITPEAGARHAAFLQTLADATGWQFEVHPQANQQALQALFSSLLPPGNSAQLSFQLTEQRVRAKLPPGTLAPGQAEALTKTFFERTCWRLRLDR
jgi:Cft2 family RNA processing exonuclease